MSWETPVRVGTHEYSEEHRLGRSRDSEEPDGDAIDWGELSVSMGEVALPLVRDLHDRVPQLTAVMVCTADGFNLCALGVDEYHVGQLAALTSSLYAVSAAAMRAAAGASEMPLDHITLVRGTTHLVSTSMAHPRLGQVLLWAVADDVPLGLLLVSVRGTSERLAGALRHL